MSPRRRPDAGTLVAWLAPLLIVLVMVGPSLFGLRLFAAGDLIDSRAAPWVESTTVEEVRNVCVSDTVDSVIPSALEFRQRVADGDRAPLWDDGASAGAMLGAAPPQGVASPLFLATLPFSDASFTGWLKLLEIVTAVTGVVLWARRLGLSTAAGAVGGLVFATSGFMVMWTNWPQTRTAVFFPLLFWALERIVQDRTVRSALPLPFVVAGLALGGFPAVAVHAVYLGAAYAVLRLVVANRADGTPGAWRRWGKAPVLAAAGAALGAVLVAFQLLPWLEQLSATDLGYRENMWAFTFGVREMLTAAYPQALGTCASDALRWGSVIPVEGVSFIGAGALVLCVAALVLPSAGSRMTGVRPFWLLAGGLTFAVTFLGGALNQVLSLLPLMDNSPMHRMRGIGGLMFAMLAAAGFEAVRRSARTRRVLPWLGVVAAPLLLAAAAYAAYRLAPEPAAWAQVRTSVLLGLAAGLVVALAWAWVMSGLRGRAVAVVLIPLALAADALLFTDAFWPRTEPDLLYRDTVTDRFLRENLGHDRMVGVGYAYWNGANKVAGVRSLSGHTFVPPEWQELLEAMDENMFLTPTNHTLSSLPALTDPLLDRFAVRYGVVDLTAPPVGELQGDGEQDPSRTVVLQDRPATRELAPVGLRGVAVEVAEPLGDVAESADPAQLLVEVRDGTGEVVATAERRVRDNLAGLVTIPVDGEHLATATGPLTVEVSAVGSPELVVVAGADGPWVGAVTATDDGLDLVLTQDAQVYERSAPMPRFRWAEEVRACDEECADVLAGLPDQVALLPEQDAARVAFDGLPAVVDVEADTADHKRVRVAADGAGMLVVADAFQDGWHAYVDGEPVDLLRADHALTGVAVPAGEHVVELSYEPVGWSVLPWVAVVTAGGLVVLWVLIAQRGRRR
ncbi:YfhO family protein [Georgenia sp. H159]|uniref:YfhO family protein n=1 Tax=Georgenia sp. H159 TaxID=3076115 RepID=UPI002D78B7A8|nr:YfhO family protein [Georgenia sp. H159]